jgi:Cu(I)-responsive transcriptional regulator
MQIGSAAKASGVTAKMIRHYEVIGLIPSADRMDSNYRSYSPEDVHRLQFVRRARALGFSMDQIRELLKLWSDRNRCSSEVKAIAMAHVAEMETKITHMREMADALHRLADACEGDDRPECPIIRSLEGAPSATLATPGHKATARHTTNR